MSGNEEVSLHDEIKAAFAATNAKTEEVDNSKVIDKLEEKEDETEGKTTGDEISEAVDKASAEDDKAAPEVKDEGAAEAPVSNEVKLTESKAPTSWSPKVREKWAELPEEVRSEIIRREEASVNGVRKLQEEYAPIRGFVEGLTPFLQEAAQLGMNPADHVRNVLAAERNLRAPDVNARFEALLGIADSYGIPLRQALNTAAGKELLPVQPAAPQVPQELMHELQEQRRWRESMESKTIEQQVTAFQEGKEFFNDVRETMADLLDGGIAKDLQDAYDKACRLNPEVYEVILSREREGKSKEQFKQRQAAAAGASVAASGAAEVQVDVDDDDSTEAVIRRAIRDSSGRV